MSTTQLARSFGALGGLLREAMAIRGELDLHLAGRFARGYKRTHGATSGARRPRPVSVMGVRLSDTAWVGRRRCGPGGKRRRRSRPPGAGISADRSGEELNMPAHDVVTF